jgi:hypothetical protein
LNLLQRDFQKRRLKRRLDRLAEGFEIEQMEMRRPVKNRRRFLLRQQAEAQALDAPGPSA